MTLLITLLAYLLITLLITYLLTYLRYLLSLFYLQYWTLLLTSLNILSTYFQHTSLFTNSLARLIAYSLIHLLFTSTSSSPNVRPIPTSPYLTWPVLRAWFCHGWMDIPVRRCLLLPSSFFLHITSTSFVR